MSINDDVNDKGTQTIQASTGDPTDRDGQTIQETTVPLHLQAGHTTVNITNRKRKKTDKQANGRGQRETTRQWQQVAWGMTFRHTGGQAKGQDWTDGPSTDNTT